MPQRFASESAEFSTKEPGQLISHYRLLRRLGEGAMGTVYLAEDTRLGRQVALKFIHSAQLKEKQAKDRLFREARAAALIDHPNVAAVYEVGEVENHPFIAMAYVKGQSLEDRILGGPLEIDEAVRIARQLADGLEAAHRQDIIHRDLNPANVILGDDGRVRIIDFGLAQLGFASRLTQPGTDIGTANYVSPEQMRGEAVDQRTDIWSLGVILYELLTARSRDPRGAGTDCLAVPGKEAGQPLLQHRRTKSGSPKNAVGSAANPG
jgi:serine/threonine protein kinase